MKKTIILNFTNTGGEYTFGYIEPGIENEILREKIEEGTEIELNNTFDNYQGEEAEINVMDYDQLIHIYGPALNGLSVSKQEFEDSEQRKEIPKGNMANKKINKLNLNYFTMENPYPGDIEDLEEEILFIGGYNIEKNINYSVKIELNENEKFDWSFVYVGTVNMDEILSGDEIVKNIFYINEEKAKEILKIYLKSEYSEKDILKDYFEDIYRTEYENKENILTLIESCKLEIEGDIEGGGNYKGEYVIIKDIDENTLFETDM